MGRKKVKIGGKFGALTVIKKAMPYISPNGFKTTQYLCKCDCGNERVVIGSSLTSGATTLWGCTKNHRQKVDDLTKKHRSSPIGKMFGKLTVIERTEPLISRSGIKQTRYLCCCNCGNTIAVTSSPLLGNKVLSCGCDKEDNVVGSQYGHLTVISEVEPYKSKGRRYLCACDCGASKVIARSALLSGATSDCGHIKKIRNPKNYKIGEKYGMLTIISEAPSGKSHDPRVICRCECGNTKAVFVNHLKDGTTKSCGCLVRSLKGAFEINGVSKNLKEWSVFYGIPYSVVQSRVYSRGWDKVKAVTTPLIIKNT